MTAEFQVMRKAWQMELMNLKERFLEGSAAQGL